MYSHDSKGVLAYSFGIASQAKSSIDLSSALKNTGQTASPPNLFAVQFVKTEIRRFLACHPGSADTLEGRIGD
jgi:hypothetical protein